MDVREKLVDIVCDATQINRCIHSCNHPPCAMVSGIVDALIKNGVTVQEWISVTERLPENIANRVLVVCERSNGVFFAHYEKQFWINLETDKPFISTVTHWMSPPEPPKGE